MSTKVAFKNTLNKLRFYFSFLLFTFYLVIAFLFLFSDIWADMIPKGRGLIGLILLLFGGFRFYVAYRRYKNKDTAIQNLQQAKQKNTIETQQHVTVE